MTYPPRILRIVYRSNHHPRRVVETFAKVPYSGIYGLSETLGRAMSTEQIMWYRIERVAPKDIAAVRSGLARWPEALERTSEQTFVKWER
jgi:hypothetical protein